MIATPNSHLVPLLTRAIAIAFAYFETLVKCGNINLVQSEVHRMTELNKYVEEVIGGDESILELMMEATLLLFNDIITDMSERNDPMPNLFAKFNDPQTSNCYVYHLRLLAAARLKDNRDEYEPYLDDTIQNYIDKTVMPVNREIDHICVVALHHILLRPTNMVLDIAYLDRSEGTEVNVHRLPEEANGQDPSTLGPIIYLLYRPDHYDILYRDTQVHIAPVPAMPAPVELRINRVNSFVPHNQDFEEPVAAMQDTSYSMDMTALAMIPGLPSTLSPPPMTDPYASSPASSWVSHFTPEVISPPPQNQPSPPQQQATVHQLRFSKYNFPNLHEMAAESGSAHEPPFTTNTFKNSHFNTAHYNNLNFQPEMYQPDAEEEASSNGHSKIGGRKRSTEHCPGIKKRSRNRGVCASCFLALVGLHFRIGVAARRDVSLHFLNPYPLFLFSTQLAFNRVASSSKELRRYEPTDTCLWHFGHTRATALIHRNENTTR